jgi:hypothetical protein
MAFQDFIRGLNKRMEVTPGQFHIGGSASEALITETEIRLGAKFPQDIKLFYLQCNGFSVIQPAIKVLSLAELEIDFARHIGFAIIDNKHTVCFDASNKIEAEQWSILNQSTGFCITLTMKSFCYNKCFAWIDKRRPIWENETYA